MNPIANRRRRLLGTVAAAEPASRRWLAGRRGSVLILVVGLVVILALLGTAFITTARVDRYQSAVSAELTLVAAEAADVQVDVISNLTGDLYADPLLKTKYRRVEPTGTYQHWDANRRTVDHDAPVGTGGTTASVAVTAATDLDTYLADRLPILVPSPRTADTFVPAWRAVSQLNQAPGQFVDIGANKVLGSYAVVPYETATTGTRPGQVLVPTAVTLVSARTDNENPRRTPKVVPAFQMYTWDGKAGALTPAYNNGTGTGASPFIAADADGDGVADSLLFDLHVTTPSNGGDLSYFAGVRVVDNNSAVNVNTAWSRLSDYALPTSPGGQRQMPFESPAGTATDALGTSISGGGATGTGAGNLGVFPTHVGLLELLDPNKPTGVAANFNEMDLLNQLRFGTPGSIAPTPYEYALTGTTAAVYPRTDFRFDTAGNALFMQLVRRAGNPDPNGVTTNGRYAVADDDTGDLFLRGGGMINAENNATVNVSPFFAGTSNNNLERRLVRSAYMNAVNWVASTDNRFSLYPADKSLYWYDYTYNVGSVLNNDGPVEKLDVAGDPEGGAPSPDGPYRPLQTAGVAKDYARNLRPLLVASNPTSNAVPVHAFGLEPTTNLPTVPVPDPGTTTGGGTTGGGGGLGGTATATVSYMAKYQNGLIPTKASLNTGSFAELWTAYWNVMCNEADPTRPANAGQYTFVPQTGVGSSQQQMLIRAALAAVNTEGLRGTTDAVVSSGASINDVISHHLIIPADAFGGSTQLDVEVFAHKPQTYITAWAGVSFDNGAGEQPVTADNGISVELTLTNPSQRPVSLNNVHVVLFDGTNYTSMATITEPVAATQSATPVAINFPKGFKPTPVMELIVMRPRRADGVTTASTGLGTAAIVGDQFDETNDNYADWVPLDRIPVRPEHTRDLDWRCVMNPKFTHGQNPVPVQLQNRDFAGPNAVGTGLTRFPFGGFARVGDVLKVPFAGTYTVRPYTGGTTGGGGGGGGGSTGAVRTYYPMPMDLAWCASREPGEEPGRFCPLRYDPQHPSTSTRFDWAARVFDYVTAVQNPDTDYSPNVTPRAYPGLAPAPVANALGATANSQAEHAVGVEGLININTAGWQVLSALPMVPGHKPTTTAGAADEEENVGLAKAIVYYRDVDDGSGSPHGPFKTVWELNLVKDTRPGKDPAKTFQNRFGTIALGPTYLPTVADGDFSPQPAAGATGVTVYDDFESKYLALTNISNLVTTRSDTFTCYVVVQAWRNVGLGVNNPTPPELVDIKRVVFEANRCPTRPGSPTVSVRQIAN